MLRGALTFEVALIVFRASDPMNTLKQVPYDFILLLIFAHLLSGTDSLMALKMCLVIPLWSWCWTSKAQASMASVPLRPKSPLYKQILASSVMHA